MKPLSTILIALVLSGCVSAPSFSIRQHGDDGYYGFSRSAYSYVDGLYGFPYFGPYDRYWYHPVWYSPLMGDHYSWCRPHDYWQLPRGVPASRVVSADRNADEPAPRDPMRSAPVTILPVDLGQAVVGARVSKSVLEKPVYRSSGSKQRALVKSSKYPAPSYGAPRSRPSAAHRSSRPVIRSASPRRSPVNAASKNEF